MTGTPLYPAVQYTYRVLWSEDDQQYVGVCSEFPAVSYLAKTHAAALEGVIGRVRDVLEDKRKVGEDPPPPKAIRLIGRG